MKPKDTSKTLGTAAALLALAALAAAPAAAVEEAGAIAGRWETAGGKAHIEIRREGEAFVGEIVWLGRPLYDADDPGGMAGQPRVDRENPDPALRRRPILGLRLLEGLHYSGDGEWTGGTIYDAETGKTYKCKARLGEGGDVLHLRGFIGFSLLGRTTEWTRVPADAPPPP